MHRAHRSRRLGLNPLRHGFTPTHAMVVIILLSSILSPASLAQPAPCPPEYPLDPAVGTCVDPETGEPVDPRTGEPLTPGEGEAPTEEPTVVVPEGDLASFTLYHLACDDDFDPDGVRDAGGLGRANGCYTYGTPPFTYTISANGTVIFTSTTEAVERDFVRLDVPGPIPAGSLTIAVAPAAGYTTEFISCGSRVTEGPTDVFEPPIAGGAATFSTLPNQEVQCWVYNVTRVPTGTVNMAHFSAACPADAVINADLDRFCTDGLVNVTYEIRSGTETLATSVSDGNGTFFFENVPDGQLTIVESVPDRYGELYVLCTHYSPTNGDREYAPTIESGNGFTVTVAPGDDLNCTWYNFAAGAGEETAGDTNEEQDGEGIQGVFADPGQTASGITISTYYCPAGTVATDDLIAACDQRASGLTFSLLTETETVASLTTDAAGDVYFSGVAPNTYGISLSLPAGYGEPIVMCYHAFANGLVEEGPEEIVFGNQFRFTIFEDGESVECAWYNVPAQGADTGPNIFIEARTCNPGTSISSSMDVFDAQAVCPFFYVDLPFRVLNVDQVIATGRTNVESTSAGQVFFTKLPEPESGGFGVIAGVREGERTLAVYCDQDFGDGTFQIVPVRVSGDRMDQETGMGAGNTMRCTWFIEMNPMMLGTHAPDAPAQGDAAQDQAAGDEPATEEPGDVAEPGVPEHDLADPDETLAEPQADEAPPATDDEEAGTESESEGVVAPGLTVLALVCPPEVAGADVVLDELCTQPASDLTFEILVDGNPFGTVVTDANGDLAIPVEAGPGIYLFRHQPAAGLLELRTDCSAVYPDGSTATSQSSAVGADMGEIYLNYDGLGSVTCAFYFVTDPTAAQAADAPEEPGDEASEGESAAEDGDAATSAHSLTLQFWTCPEGVDPAGDRSVLSQACGVETGERSFMLTIDGVTTGETITGPTTWEFQSQTVYADIGAGTTSSAWCESSWTGDDAGAPDTVSLEGGALTVTVNHPATTVSCDWFIFPG